MKIVNQISIAELKNMATNFFGDMVKVVVDIENKIIALDAQLHVDLELILLQSGSKQHNLWGINLYPALFDQDDFIEFDSMINIRPNQNNLSRSVEDETVKNQIINIIKNSVKL